jgi:putative glycosyltransferase (TIGR04372 family)
MRLKDFVGKINSIYSYDQGLSKGFPNFYSLNFKFLLSRTVAIAFAIPMSILLGAFFLLTSPHKKTKIVILRQYRPSFASQYIAMVEPLQRLTRNCQGKSHQIILLNPGESFNRELQYEADDAFWMNLDDRRPFLRLVFFLIPRLFLEKHKIWANTFLYSNYWDLPAKRVSCKPTAIISQLGLKPFDFVCFSHPSRRYYRAKGISDNISESRFVDMSNYSAPFEHLQNRGLKIVRVGRDTDDMPRSFSRLPIFDASRCDISELDELWLYSNCNFFLSIAGNGAWWFSKKYGRPSIITDGYQFFDGHQSTFQSQQVIWDNRSSTYLEFKKHLTVQEIDLISPRDGNDFKTIPNPPQLLIDAFDEIYEFAQHGHSYTNEELALLQTWDLLTNEFGLRERQENWTRPSIAFLKTYKDLL